MTGREAPFEFVPSEHPVNDRPSPDMRVFEKIGRVKHVSRAVAVGKNVRVNREFFERQPDPCVGEAAFRPVRNGEPDLHQRFVPDAVIKIKSAAVVCDLGCPIIRGVRIQRPHCSADLLPIYKIRGTKDAKYISVLPMAGAVGKIRPAELQHEGIGK